MTYNQRQALILVAILFGAACFVGLVFASLGFAEGSSMSDRPVTVECSVTSTGAYCTGS